VIHEQVNSGREPCGFRPGTRDRMLRDCERGSCGECRETVSDEDLCMLRVFERLEVVYLSIWIVKSGR
jgi:hypothetical protein